MVILCRTKPKRGRGPEQLLFHREVGAGSRYIFLLAKVPSLVSRNALRMVRALIVRLKGRACKCFQLMSRVVQPNVLNLTPILSYNFKAKQKE